MRNLTIMALLGVIVCTQALAAVDSADSFSTDPGAQTPALSEKYLERFLKSYSSAHAAANKPAGAKEAPFDILSVAHAVAGLSPALAACQAQISSSNTEMFQCRMAAVRQATADEKLRDTSLTDSYADTVMQIASDADAGRITRPQMPVALQAVSNAYDLLVNLEYSNYLAAMAPVAADQPPFDQSALKDAQDAFNKAKPACDSAIADAAFGDCLTKLDDAFTAAIKMRDLTLTKQVASLMQTAIADAAAGTMSREELSKTHDLLAAIYRMAIQTSYNQYLVKQYAALYDQTYSSLKEAGGAPIPPGPLFDPAEVAQSVVLRNTDVAQCNQSVEATKTKSARMECYIAANKRMADSTKLSDSRFFDAFAQVMRRAGASADAGTLTPLQLNAVYLGVLQDFTRTVDREANLHAAAGSIETIQSRPSF